MSHCENHPTYNITYIELLMSRIDKSKTDGKEPALTIIGMLESMLTPDAIESCKSQALGIVNIAIDMDRRMTEFRKVSQ